MHNHDHTNHSQCGDVRTRSTRVLKIGLGLILLFMLVQLIGGWLANSLALMADAAHMATDAASFALSLFAFWIAKRPASARMSYGFYRAEILGAVASGLMLWAISGVLIYAAILRILSPKEVEGGLVFIIALVTLLINLLMMRMLHDTQKENLNVKAAYLHVLSDLLGSLGVLIAGALIWFTGWNIIDPIFTILFTGLIVVSSWRMMREGLEILMEASPRRIDPNEVERALRSIPVVEDLHDLHIWTVSSGMLALSVHLISRQTERALDLAHEELKRRFQISHTTIQVEHPDTFQKEYCYDCSGNGRNTGQ